MSILCEDRCFNFFLSSVLHEIFEDAHGPGWLVFLVIASIFFILVNMLLRLGTQMELSEFMFRHENFPFVLTERTLYGGLHDANRLDHRLNFNLFHQLGLSFIEEPVFRSVLATSTPEGLWYNLLTVEFQRTEEARVDLLILVDVRSLLKRFVQGTADDVHSKVVHSSTLILQWLFLFFYHKGLDSKEA